METIQTQTAPQAAPVASPSASAETMVRLTDKAAAMVRETIEREGLVAAGLRVAVVGGGCSGFQYSLDLEKEGRAPAD